MEELDYLCTLLGSAIVKHELDAQINQSGATPNATWITQILAITVGFSHIPTEDTEMWELDVNCFLSEETSETANYSARTACSELVKKLSDFPWPIPESLLAYSKTVYEDPLSR